MCIRDRQKDCRTNSLYRNSGFWDGKYQSSIERLDYIRTLVSSRTRCLTGNHYDNWDLQVYGGLFGSAKLHLMVEHHGENSEFVRYRAYQCWSLPGIILLSTLTLVAILTFTTESYIASGFSALTIALISLFCFREGAHAIGLIEFSIEKNISEVPMDIGPASTTDTEVSEAVLNVA